MEFDEGKLKEPNEEALAKFCQTLKTIQARHTTVVQTMAQGVLELKDFHPVHNLFLYSTISIMKPSTFILGGQTD